MDLEIYKFKLSVDIDNIDDALIYLNNICTEYEEITIDEIETIRILKKLVIRKYKKKLNKLNDSINKEYLYFKENLESLNSNTYNLNKIEKDEDGCIIFNNYINENTTLIKKVDSIIINNNNIQNSNNNYSKLNIVNNSFKSNITKDFSYFLLEKTINYINKLLNIVNYLIDKSSNNKSLNYTFNNNTNEEYICLLLIKCSILKFTINYFDNKEFNIQNAYFTYIKGIEFCLLHIPHYNEYKYRFYYSYIKFLHLYLKDYYRSFLFLSEFKTQINNYIEKELNCGLNIKNANNNNSLIHSSKINKENEFCNLMLAKLSHFYDNYIEDYKNVYRKYFPKLKHHVF